MQILNNGLFAQDILGTEVESVAIHSITDYVNSSFHHKKQNAPKHQQKQHRHTLKQSSVKFINHSNFSFQKLESCPLSRTASKNQNQRILIRSF